MDLKAPSTRLALPFIILMITAGFYDFDSMWVKVGLMITGLVGVALVFVFRQPIHWYWYCQVPPPIAPEMIAILEHKMPYFRNLSVDNKRYFLRRMSLFLMAKEMESLNEDEMLPADIRGLIAATAVQINFGQKRFLFPQFRKIIVHPSLFLSAEINKKFHASETFIDPEYKGHSCQIFAGDRLMHSFNDARTGYNIVLHEMANVFLDKKELHYIESTLKTDKEILTKFESIRGFNYNQILDYTHNPSMSFFGLAIEHLYYNPTKFKEVLPDLFNALIKALNQNPINMANPVIDAIDYELLLEKSDIY